MEVLGPQVTACWCGVTIQPETYRTTDGNNQSKNGSKRSETRNSTRRRSELGDLETTLRWPCHLVFVVFVTDAQGKSGGWGWGAVTLMLWQKDYHLLLKFIEFPWISLILRWSSVELACTWRPLKALITVNILELKHQLVPGAEKEAQSFSCKRCQKTATWWTWCTWWMWVLHFYSDFDQGLWRWRPALQGSLKVGLKEKSRTSQWGSPESNIYLWQYLTLFDIFRTFLVTLLVH